MTAVTPRRLAHAGAADAAGFATAHWRALGTSAQVVVVDPATLAQARRVVEDVLAEMDRAASRFRADSDLARVNSAAGTWTEVSPMLARAVRVALDAAAWTDGLVDPTVGNALVDLGYDRTFSLVPADLPGGVLTVHEVAGWRSVDIDGARVRVPAGTVLDLGATAKGLAADLAADAAAEATGSGVLLNLGGDVAVAGPPPADGWSVAVGDTSDPELDDDGPSQNVTLSSGGLATSSTTARRWRRGGSWVHHIVDPRSGRTADAPWRTVSVTAETCVLANTASTAAIVLGNGAGPWLERRGLAARLVAASGQVAHVGGWPQGGETR